MEEKKGDQNEHIKKVALLKNVGTIERRSQKEIEEVEVIARALLRIAQIDEEKIVSILIRIETEVLDKVHSKTD